MKNVCTLCAERIRTYGAPAADVFERIADAYFAGMFFIIFDEASGFVACDRPIIEFLEMKYLVLTSEIDRLSIGVIPNVLTAITIANGDSLCWCHMDEVCYGD